MDEQIDKKPEDTNKVTGLFGIRDKKFSELSTGKKILFFVCLGAMISVLVFWGLNLDKANVRTDIIKEANGCTFTFVEGILTNQSCLFDSDMISINRSNYTISDYYADRSNLKASEDIGYTLNITG